jgi:hypothetical protein
LARKPRCERTLREAVGQKIRPTAAETLLSMAWGFFLCVTLSLVKMKTFRERIIFAVRDALRNIANNGRLYSQI